MVIVMNTVTEIADFIKENDNFVIIPHRRPDGDCLGSSSALLLSLRQLGKNARIALPSEVPGRLAFMWDESFEEGTFPADNVIAVDVADPHMMLDLYDEYFCNAKKTLCIDHHGTNCGYADLNCIKANAAAAGEIVYGVITAMGTKLNREIAEKLFVSIADDTGGFQYSNTTSETHGIISKLYTYGVESDDIMKKLFATHTMAEMELLKFVTKRLEYYFGGKVCTSYVDSEALEKSGAEMSQADAWIGLTRSAEGVEVGVMFKVADENEIRVSLRSNRYVDVSAVAQKFGGGGHVRAAGVTFYEGLESAKKKLLDEFEKLV